MTLKECILVRNSCYIQGTKMKPIGILVHSTGCNNKTLRRYVNPVKGQEKYQEIIEDIGVNTYNNHWNRSATEMDTSKCVHAFIGTNLRGEIETYQTLPFNIASWGCGSGTNGSYNYNPYGHIQFEICEDNLKDDDYFHKAMKEAQEFCAYLCNKYKLSSNTICSHYKKKKKGYASNHNDCDFWLKKFNKDMDWFRAEVAKLLKADATPKTLYHVEVGQYTVRENAQQTASRLRKAGFSAHVVERVKTI